MTVRWGIIGCGDVCEIKSGPPLYQVPNSSLRIVMRRDLAAAQDFAQRHNVRSFTADAAEVIEHPEVDAVYIATPPGTHCQYALAVAASGKPCYVEKPMARHASECRQMVSAFAKAQQPLFVAYYRRALPRFLRARDILQSGKLGELCSIHHTYQGRANRSGQPPAGPSSSNWRQTATISGGGLFLDLGSHVLDLMDFLLGPLSSVNGLAMRCPTAANLGGEAHRAVEDTVVASFRVGANVLGGVWHKYNTAQSLDRLEVVGSVGRLSLSVFGVEPLELWLGEELQSISVEQPQHVQEPLMQSIVAQLEGQSVYCPSTGQSALRTSEVMDQILDEYYAGRGDEFWRRPESWPGALSAAQQLENKGKV